MILLLALLLQAAQPPAAGGFSRNEDTEDLHFSYQWPATAEAVPALRRLLQADMEREHRQALAGVREARQRTGAIGNGFMAHHYEKWWSVAGSDARLLSLSGTRSAFAGGAHGDTAFYALLWDRQGNRRIQAGTIFTPALLRRLGSRFCAALDAEREAQRGEPVVARADDPHTLCPPLAERVLVPLDADEDGRFDSLRVLIPAYVAGPYAEGPYLIDVGLRTADLGLIPAGYRRSFETAGAPS